MAATMRSAIQRIARSGICESLEYMVKNNTGGLPMRLWPPLDRTMKIERPRKPKAPKVEIGFWLWHQTRKSA